MSSDPLSPMRAVRRGVVLRVFGLGAAVILVLGVASVGAGFGVSPAHAATGTAVSWHEMTPHSSPPARSDASMAYDPATGNVLLFGGNGGTTALDDTWTWDGTTWTELSPPTSPSARMGASMAYDPATGDMVLFGGTGGNLNTALGDTWTWNGSNWTQIRPATSPPARYGASMSFDSATGDMVLFGGADGLGAGTAGGVLDDTWTWDGTTWSEHSPSRSPGGRVFGVSAFDPATGNLVLFGGETYTVSPSNTYRTTRGSGTAPPGRNSRPPRPPQEATRVPRWRMTQPRATSRSTQDSTAHRLPGTGTARRGAGSPTVPIHRVFSAPR